MRGRSGAALAFSFLLALPATAASQSLSDAFDQLFTFGSCGEALCLDVNSDIHGSHYLPDVVQGQDNLLNFLSVAIGNSVANLPIAAATGGVTFTFEGGVPVAQEVSAGPIFAERAQTLTQGRLLIGANVTGASFSEVRGLSMNALQLAFVHVNVGDAAYGDPVFEGDVIEVETDMDVSVIVASLAASYGVTDNIDLGIVVPIVNASLSGSSSARVIPAGETTPHQFGTSSNPSNTATTSSDASASGIGDVGVRVKIGFPSQSVGFALVGEARLPTGSEEDFLGTGAATFRALGVLSAQRGDFYPHLNAGMLVRSGEDATNGALVTVGFDHLLTPNATLAVDLLTNWQLGDGITFAREAVYDVPVGRTVALTNIPEATDHLIDLSIGGKFSAGSALRVVTNLIFPINSGGIRPGLGWTAGLEYDFF